eukprot:Nk52_evm1s1223 gene=Nk52_evmTU1s1223
MSFGGPEDDVIFFTTSVASPAGDHDRYEYKSVPRVSSTSLTSNEFKDIFYKCSQPVIITDFVTKWPAFSNFNNRINSSSSGSLKGAAYLKQNWGSVSVLVDESPNDYFPDDDKLRKENQNNEATMTFAGFIDKLQGNYQNYTRQGKQAPTKLYLQHTALDFFDRMQDEMILPPYFNHSLLQSTNIWFGGGGHAGECHYDVYSNFLCQISGSKHLKLIPPRFYTQMSPTVDTKKKNFSHVNTNDPRVEKASTSTHPKYTKILHEVYETTLGPGEMLFIPVWWWHQVTGLPMNDAGEQEEGFNISMNIWWTPSICPLCQRQYIQPTWFVQCTHTFCEDCLVAHLVTEFEQTACFAQMLLRSVPPPPPPAAASENHGDEEDKTAKQERTRKSLLNRIRQAIEDRSILEFTKTFAQSILKLPSSSSTSSCPPDSHSPGKDTESAPSPPTTYQGSFEDFMNEIRFTCPLDGRVIEKFHRDYDLNVAFAIQLEDAMGARDARIVC